MAAVARIKASLVETEERIKDSGQAYRQLEQWGYRNLQLEALHHHAGQTNSKLRRIFHSFNMREINNFTTEIQEVVDRTVETHELIERLRRTQRHQTLVGLAAVALLLCFAATLVYFKHTYLEGD
jgi:hypothetical protein